jgi:hypothetical protein
MAEVPTSAIEALQERIVANDLLIEAASEGAERSRRDHNQRE